MHSRNMARSPYNKEVEMVYCFSGLVKRGATMCIVAEEQMTRSVASEVLFVKVVDSSICLVRWLKRTCDVREFLKHCTRETAPFNLPSSSCRTISTDIPDLLLPLLPIVHRFWLVLRATSCILTELLYVGLSWLPCFCSVMWGGP